MNRRGFLGSILALGVAPAVVSSGVLMPVRTLLLPGEEVMEFGSYEGFTFIESIDGGFFEDATAADISPVNFIFMRQLLEAARKKLPYFDGTVVVGKPAKIHWNRITFGEVRA